MRALQSVFAAVVVVGCSVVAAGCCCPCAYAATGGVPDVAQAIRPEVAPRLPLQAR